MRIDPRWNVVESSFNLEASGHYEALFTLGNGYMGTRGAYEENYRVRTPGTFLAGLFNKMPYEVTELPNLPDWLSVEFMLDGERFDLTQGEILNYERILRLKEGILVRNVLWKSPKGQITRLTFTRFVSLHDHHLSGLKIEIIPETYSGIVKITSSLNGQVTNSGTQHFAPIEQSTFGEQGIYLINESYEHKYLLVQAANHHIEGQIEKEGFRNDTRYISYWSEIHVESGGHYVFEKLVTTYSSRDLEFKDSRPTKDELLSMTSEKCLRAGKQGFEAHLEQHQKVWHSRWEEADLVIEGTEFDQLALRFAIFHLIQMTSCDDYRVSIAAKGLSGEGYRGHVFWDTEIFMFPFFLHVFPDAARNLLRYRHHTLPGAIRKAQENGYEGAMFAWESADTGDETTPTVGGIDFKTKKPIPILCGQLEQHITADIAYAVAHYMEVTGDREFLETYGAEIVLLGARFWASRVEYSQQEDCYEINGVIGPDEYKEDVDNNYFTNALAKRHLEYAAEVFEETRDVQTVAQWNFSSDEVKRWMHIASKMKLLQEGDLLVQFEGFLDLPTIDVLKYRDTPGKLQQAYSWREINGAQVLKQADVIMLLHLLSHEFTEEQKKINWDYYEPKTMHDSSLSAVIHCIVANDIGQSKEAYKYFEKASRIDLGNRMGNSSHGLHAASLGGLWQAAVHGFGGVRVVDGVVYCYPHLPQQWNKLEFKLHLGKARLQFVITTDNVTIMLLTPEETVRAVVYGEKITLNQVNQTVTTKAR